MPAWPRRNATQKWRENTARKLFVMVIQSPHHPKGELVGLLFGISPKHIMAHLVVDHIDPTPFRVIFSTLLPVFRMDQIDLSIFISFAGGFAPFNILEAFHLRILLMIETAKRGNGSF